MTTVRWARLLGRTLWYLAILVAVFLMATRSLGEHPSFIYQGF